MLEYLGLLDLTTLETSPVINQLKEQFKKQIPPWFSLPYFVPTPPNAELKSIIRANCGNDGCSVRAVVHVVRDANGVLKIEEKTPIFDRLQNPCHSCREFLKIK